LRPSSTVHHSIEIKRVKELALSTLPPPIMDRPRESQPKSDGVTLCP
jgi:hypothetical protein